MSWFRVDDQVTFHPKTLKVGNSALGAWLRLGTYCAAQLTDGFVPGEIARMIASKRELDALESASMIHADGDGYVIHDYLEYQPSKQDIKDNRADTKERVKRYRNAKRNAVTTTVSNANVLEGRGGDKGSSSSVSGSERAPAWFCSLWADRSRALMVDHAALQPVFALVMAYHAKCGISDRATAELLLDGYQRVVETWSAPRWSAHLFVKHWEEVQSRAVDMGKKYSNFTAPRSAVAVTTDEDL
jgi:hypothetical protein